MVVFDGHEYLTAEERRLKEDRHRTKYWKKWGPYVSERQWATGKCAQRSFQTSRWEQPLLTLDATLPWQ
jgi:hypothetical protein